MWNVYVASSWMRWEVRPALREGVAGLIGEGLRGAVAAEMVAEREFSSEGVEPIRVIFFDRRSVRGIAGSLKGGFWRPSLGVIRSFWLEGGMERSEAIVEERSSRVDVVGNLSVVGFP